MKPVLGNNEVYCITDVANGKEYYFTSLNKAALFFNTKTPAILNMLEWPRPRRIHEKFYTCVVMDGGDLMYRDINPEPKVEPKNASGFKMFY